MKKFTLLLLSAIIIGEAFALPTLRWMNSPQPPENEDNIYGEYFVKDTHAGVGERIKESLDDSPKTSDHNAVDSGNTADEDYYNENTGGDYKYDFSGETEPGVNDPQRSIALRSGDTANSVTDKDYYDENTGDDYKYDFSGETEPGVNDPQGSIALRSGDTANSATDDDENTGDDNKNDFEGELERADGKSSTASKPERTNGLQGNNARDASTEKFGANDDEYTLASSEELDDDDGNNNYDNNDEYTSASSEELDDEDDKDIDDTKSTNKGVGASESDESERPSATENKDGNTDEDGIVFIDPDSFDTYKNSGGRVGIVSTKVPEAIGISSSTLKPNGNNALDASTEKFGANDDEYTLASSEELGDDDGNNNYDNNDEYTSASSEELDDEDDKDIDDTKSTNKGVGASESDESERPSATENKDGNTDEDGIVFIDPDSFDTYKLGSKYGDTKNEDDAGDEHIPASSNYATDNYQNSDEDYYNENTGGDYKYDFEGETESKPDTNGPQGNNAPDSDMENSDENDNDDYESASSEELVDNSDADKGTTSGHKPTSAPNSDLKKSDANDGDDGSNCDNVSASSEDVNSKECEEGGEDVDDDLTMEEKGTTRPVNESDDNENGTNKPEVNHTKGGHKNNAETNGFDESDADDVDDDDEADDDECLEDDEDAKCNDLMTETIKPFDTKDDNEEQHGSTVSNAYEGGDTESQPTKDDDSSRPNDSESDDKSINDDEEKNSDAEDDGDEADTNNSKTDSVEGNDDERSDIEDDENNSEESNSDVTENPNPVPSPKANKFQDFADIFSVINKDLETETNKTTKVFNDLKKLFEEDRCNPSVPRCLTETKVSVECVAAHHDKIEDHRKELKHAQDCQTKTAVAIANAIREILH